MSVERFKLRDCLIRCGVMIVAITTGLVSANGQTEDAKPDPVDPAETYFSNVELTDQDGNVLKLFQDLMKDKVVVVQAFATRHTGADPVINRTFQEIQNAFPDQIGKGFSLVSITVEPEHDTPSILKTYSTESNAKAGWYFLSGNKQNVKLALHKFGLFTEDPESHSTILLIGNVKTGLWKKANGLAPHADIIKIVRTVLEDEIQEQESVNR